MGWSDIIDSHASATSSSLATSSVILHVDMDCFYAQCEMVENPLLVSKPIGIQQKNLVVTTNYIARKLGVQKMSTVIDAKNICKELILINGENLEKYRSFSDKINQLLHVYSNKVERLGLDENFIDITEYVERKMDRSKRYECIGHLYIPEQSSSRDVEQADFSHHNNAIFFASSIAEEFRKTLLSTLGMTCTCGISSNKMAAKLCGDYKKPDDQTILLPEYIINFLTDVVTLARKIPGIGHATNARLQNVGVTTIKELQMCDADRLATVLDMATVERLKLLAVGVDKSEVKLYAKAKSIGVEDGFRAVSSLEEVREKARDVLQRVWSLVVHDGRLPTSMKLTVRFLEYDEKTKMNLRDSKRETFHNHFLPNPPTFLSLTQSSRLEDIMMDLVKQILAEYLENYKPKSHNWYVTLLGLSFYNFNEREKSNMVNYFIGEKSATTSTQSFTLPCTAGTTAKATKLKRPSNIDEETFNSLPRDIQEELCDNNMNKVLTNSLKKKRISDFFVNGKDKN